MSYELGVLKYFIGVLLTPVGYASMYTFGSGIWNTINHFDALVTALSAQSVSELIIGVLMVYLPTPQNVVESLVLYPVVGCGIAAFLWYASVK